MIPISKNITPYNDKGLPNGYWVYFYSNTRDKLSYRGNFINGVRTGYWETYKSKQYYIV